MTSNTNAEISIEVPPYLRVHKDGKIERFVGIGFAPAGLDSKTNVNSKDITIIPETGVTARLYTPNSTTKTTKLPLLIYFHGGAFCIASTAEPVYHNSVNKIVSESNVIALSINYRLAPEHPLPTAYDDAWASLQWLSKNNKSELFENVDFTKVYLGGDSAGGNIAQNMAFKLHLLDLKVVGLILVNPYFWGKEPVGMEITDLVQKKMVDKWWEFVCPSNKGNDDPLINPFVEEAPSFEKLGVEKVLVIVAEKDILGERGRLYHKKLVNSGWKGNAQFYETLGEDHVFHIFNPDCDKANTLMKRIAAFINE